MGQSPLPKKGACRILALRGGTPEAESARSGGTKVPAGTEKALACRVKVY
jgi:hypothetical protein